VHLLVSLGEHASCFAERAVQTVDIGRHCLAQSVERCIDLYRHIATTALLTVQVKHQVLEFGVGEAVGHGFNGGSLLGNEER
jgi:hypothetical protein